MIPKSFQCMGYTVPVEIGSTKKDADGHYFTDNPKIVISKRCTEQVRGVTFWHEWMHCALGALGYNELNDDEEFIDRMAQCLYQLEKTRVD